MAKEISDNGTELVSITDLYAAIGQRVRIAGKTDKISSWKTAFPQVEYMNVDRDFTSHKILWPRRSFAELSVYTLYMMDPQETVLNCGLDVGGYRISLRVTDSEKIWSIWESGAFRALDPPGGAIPRRGMEALFGFATQTAGQWEEYVRYNTDMDKVSPDGFAYFVDPRAV